MEFTYDTSFRPPAPVVRIDVGSPGSNARESFDALLDTGSDISVLPRTAVERLRLERAGSSLVLGYGGTRQTPRYGILVSLSGGPKDQLTDAVTWERSFAVLGRDLVNRWRLVLDGPAGQGRIA